MLDRIAVAALLREIGTLLTIQGGERFRARAYRRAAAALEGLQGDFAALVAEGRLIELPGIGASLARLITELAHTGTAPLLQRLRASLPAGALELHDVPHMTLRRMVGLERALGVTTRQALKEACLGQRVRTVKGFGPVLEQKLLAALEEVEARRPMLLVQEVEAAGAALVAFARTLPGAEHAELAGDARRRGETVEELSVAVCAADPAAALAAFRRHPAAVRTLEAGADSCTVQTRDGLRLRAFAAPPERFGGLLVRATGSDAHVARLRALAVQRGLAHDAGGTPAWLHAGGEGEVYHRLGLPWIAPELREDGSEVDGALAGRLPHDLLTEADVRGMVHCHTEWSDGRDSILAMARAAEALGMEYITITDHSPSAHYADGLSVERLRAQADEIAAVQEQVGIRLLHGSEVDILADGALDFPDDVLARLDVVIASVHHRHRLDPEAATRRLIAALRHPCFKIWGHPLGRYLRGRPPIACDMRAVLDAAAESRVAIEVNGDPFRLDAEPQWQREARERGIPLVVSTDAHSVRQLGNLRFAVALARRGGARRGEVLNTLPCAGFTAAVRPFL